MNKKSKRFLCLLMALCLAALTALTALPALAEQEVCEGCRPGTFAGLNACMAGEGALHLCDKNFPDAHFRAFVADRFDRDGSGALEENEAQAVTSVDCSARSVADLSGVGFFSELTALDCSNNLLKKLDLSANKKLTALNCSNNALPMLRLTANTALTSLKAEGLALECPYNKEKNSVDISSLIGQFDSEYIIAIGAVDVNGNDMEAPEAGGNISFAAKDPLFATYTATTGLSGAGLSEIKVRVYPYEDIENEDGVVRTVGDRVLISAKNFPDEAFRRYVHTLAAEDGNTLTAKELGVTEIRCAGMGIADLKGIGLFKKLETLDCSGNRLAALDLSANTELKASSVKTDGQKPEGIVCVKVDGTYTVDLSAAAGSDNAAHIVSVRATTAGGADAGASYDADKGTVSFSSEPATLTYQYRIPTAVKNLPDMDVTVQLTVSEPVCESGTFEGSAAYLCNGGLHLCEKNFPDAGFLAAVKRFDTDGDGALSKKEAEAVTEIVLNSGNVASLQGVGFFTALKRLSVADNALTALDLSKNKELTALNCVGNRLTTLDLSANEKLAPGNVSVGRQTGPQLDVLNKDGRYSVDLTAAVGTIGRARVTSVSDKNGVVKYDKETGVAEFPAAPDSLTYIYKTGPGDAAPTMSVECTVGAHRHTKLTLVPAEAATCVKDGHNAYYLCSCGKMFSDEEALNEIPQGTLPTTYAYGHLPSTDFRANKLFHWFYCTRKDCGMLMDGTKVFHRDADKDGKCDECGYDMTAGVLGDVDGDNDLTPGDARLALRISVKLEKDAPSGSVAYVTADVDFNGEVTPEDARLLLRAAVSLKPLPERPATT